MKGISTLLFAVLMFKLLSAQMGMTPFENTWGEETATYQQAIDFYKQLAETYPEVEIKEYGRSDVGKPMHLVVISGQKIFDPKKAKKEGIPMILINNAIHPGEPCGVDASMMLARNLLEDKKLRPMLDELIIGIIPIYNIGGALNRGCCSRANQEGPLSYGFRGNAGNYDLNRDFIKMDTRNAHAFARIFQTWLPEIFIDTHTTNGADYQATLTLIATRPEKLEKSAAAYQTETLVPALEKYMKKKSSYHMCPYVYSVGNVPDKGIAGFLDLPRYSSGYASLFQTMSFITEAHMLKPFKDRVTATYDFLSGTVEFVSKNPGAVFEAVVKARLEAYNKKSFAVNWKLDQEKQDELMFKGFEYSYETSKVTGKDRLRYHRDKPFEKKIPYFNSFSATTVVEKPNAYILPQTYWEVEEKLKANKVEYFYLDTDTTMEVEVYYLDKVHTQMRSYEGHFYHDSVELRKEFQKIRFYKGDLIIYTNQLHSQYLVHIFEPLAADALFRWNAFDGVLMQKEYFSSYVFEERAEEILARNSELKAAFEKKKAEDESFRESARAQLFYIYTHSVHYEKTHRRYPVFRWQGIGVLPLTMGQTDKN
ncbi:MAG: hypothetical protein MRZ79_11025 [Bacteroidia bacterium]|nr:hypothetical protein [Bacteroidia bacterium]